MIDLSFSTEHELLKVLVTGCWLLGEMVIKEAGMSSFKDLEIYKLAFDLALKLHKATLLLPKYELFEQGSQIRRSSKSVKDTIAEGYGRRRYKVEFIRYLVFAQASCDEVHSQLDMLIALYPDLQEFRELLEGYQILGRKINSFIQYVEQNWKTK